MNPPKRYTMEQLAEDVEEMLEMLYENTGLRPGLDYNAVTVYVDGDPLEFEVGDTDEYYEYDDDTVRVSVPSQIIDLVRAHQIE
jgi:hypothetical protein